MGNVCLPLDATNQNSNLLLKNKLLQNPKQTHMFRAVK